MLRKSLFLTLLLLGCSPAYAQKAKDHEAYTLDRAHFASSTDWFLIDRYPTPKMGDPKKSLTFRRFYFAFVDDELRDGLANTVSFVCQRGHPNFLLIHLPDAADVRTISPRKQWISKTDLRVLTDDSAARFDAEYIDGDFFVDFTDETNGGLIEIMKSKLVTIEFGSGNERLELYTEDTGKDGKADLKGALRNFITSRAKTESWGSARIFGTNEMFGMCEKYKGGNTRRRSK
jgi:hypothetical protein